MHEVQRENKTKKKPVVGMDDCVRWFTVKTTERARKIKAKKEIRKSTRRGLQKKNPARAWIFVFCVCCVPKDQSDSEASCDVS
jgi:hypothetical protein